MTDIVVNGMKWSVVKKVLSYDDVVRIALAGKSIPVGNGLTVTYRHKPSHQAGSMLSGASVRVEEGMIFNVVDTRSV